MEKAKDTLQKWPRVHRREYLPKSAFEERQDLRGPLVPDVCQDLLPALEEKALGCYVSYDAEAHDNPRFGTLQTAIILGFEYKDRIQIHRLTVYP